jgi:hypothetical protein
MPRLPGLRLVILVKGGKNGSTNVARANTIPPAYGNAFWPVLPFDIDRTEAFARAADWRALSLLETYSVYVPATRSCLARDAMVGLESARCCAITIRTPLELAR